jgi:selenide,water dikinase
VNPRRILSNDNAKPGDSIILTKPIGVGIISTAVKRGMAEEETANRAIRIMNQLNRTAAEVLAEFPANSCTDVTGFGLLGHLKEMSRASKVDAVVHLDAVPSIAEAWQFATGNIVPGGTLSNLDYVSDLVEWNERISRTGKLILCDAQTSGGLLISIPSAHADDLLRKLHKSGVPDAAIVGNFTKKGTGKIVVRESR